ncbi:MAG: flagellar hook-associated protein FlgL [Planctomycetota bacterium]|nr:flagellar hook-associated protein FlgL [Planctomycetota bacterium]
MSIRPTQQATYAQVQRSLTANFSLLVRSQEQISSGKRIVRASDDPIGTSQALAFRRQISAAERHKTSVEGAQRMLDTASSLLQDAGGTLAESRSILIQAMNGTQSDDDRRLLADSIELIRDRLLEIGNARSGNRYLFAGTATDTAPFAATASGTSSRVGYLGNDEEQQVLVGLDSRLTSTLPGDEIFASQQRTGVDFGRLTGLAAGSTANQGTGFVYVTVRHDGTTASGLSGGVTLANSAQDTVVGNHTLVVDGAARTVTLDTGEPVAIPTNASTLRVIDERGAELNLDFSAWDGSSFTASVDGTASVSLDGTNFTPVTLTEPDLQLRDPASGSVLHVDTRALHRSGVELVTFSGTVNVFDTLQGIVDDLRNIHDLSPREQRERLDMWLVELDRNHENIQIATGELGSLSQRASGLSESYADEQVQLKSLLSGVEDVDFTQAVTDMTRAEQTLQLAQSSSSRLLQNSLLNFLR